MESQSPFVFLFIFIFAKWYLQINKSKFGINLTKFYFENGERADQLCWSKFNLNLKLNAANYLFDQIRQG